MTTLNKYPRTQHIEGSNLQPGDEDLARVPFAQLRGRHLVVEEKIDGSNSGICFSSDGRLFLQSRGHFLTGGYRERHFAGLKQFARTVQYLLQPLLSSRYVLYGEWAYAKHTIYYDRLPHHFLEFDILDTEDGTFLDTPRRQALLEPLRPYLHSVPVLYCGTLDSYDALVAFVGPSTVITQDPDLRRAHFEEACQAAPARLDIEERQTDLSGVMEGLYIKVEEDGVVKERYKWVRRSFLQIVFDAQGHWLDRPIVRNGCDEEAACTP